MSDAWEIGPTYLQEAILTGSLFFAYGLVAIIFQGHIFQKKQNKKNADVCIFIAGPLLGEFLENMEDKIKVNSSNTYKMYMYSAVRMFSLISKSNEDYLKQ